MFAGLSWEVLRRHTLQQLARYPGWVVFGIAGPVTLTIWLLVRPFDLRNVTHDLYNTVVYMLAWLVFFCVIFITYHWLRPPVATRDEGLDAAPLSALQYYLHRCSDICSVPLIVLLLTLPMFGVMLTFPGDPYASGSNDWLWMDVPNVWWIWMFFVGLNFAAAVMVPLAGGLLLQETVANKGMRIAVLLLFPPLYWYVMYFADYHFLRMCYRQTRGHDPLPYILTGLAVLVLPFLMGVLRRRGRALIGWVLGLTGAALGVLVFFSITPDTPGWLGGMRDAMGDARFALAYYAGHIQLEKNVEKIFFSYQSTVLFDDHHAGNLIPRRLSLWVGAGLYPVLLPLWSFIALGLGIAVSKRHPTE